MKPVEVVLLKLECAYKSLRSELGVWEATFSNKLQVTLVLLVHGSHTLSTCFSIPGFCSPLVPELTPCSRSPYLSEDDPNEKLSIHYVSIYKTPAMLNPAKEMNKMEASPALLRLTLCQGRHSERVIMSVILNVALEHAAGPDNLTQVITEDTPGENYFPAGTWKTNQG